MYRLSTGERCLYGNYKGLQIKVSAVVVVNRSGKRLEQ